MRFTEMGWIKKGLIFKPDGNLEWSQSHAQVPVVDYSQSEGTLSVYFSTRDSKGRSLPAKIILDSDNPKRIVKVEDQPVLTLGELGAFDDCGVMPSWIVNKPNGEKWLYYIGWNVRNTIPYHNAVGLAISSDNGKTFQRFARGPLWDRSYNDPHYSGTSCVIFDKGVWKNWYLSCTEWRTVNGRSEPRYNLKYAESNNGIDWNRTGAIAIDYKDDDEAGIVKASVLVHSNKYQLWYAYRSFNDYRTSRKSSYRIGYAESTDGVSWKRLDASSPWSLGISDDMNAWDGLMTTYPHVVDVNGKLLMFYNGNGFGQSGFGYAEWQDQP